MSETPERARQAPESSPHRLKWVLQTPESIQQTPESILQTPESIEYSPGSIQQELRSIATADQWSRVTLPSPVLTISSHHHPAPPNGRATERADDVFGSIVRNLDDRKTLGDFD